MMESFPLRLFLVSVLIAAATANTCQYSHFVGWCGGHFYTFKGSVAACQQACSDRAECKGTHYNHGQCWLQNFVCDPAKAGHKGNPIWNQYTKLNCQGATPAAGNVCDYTYFTGWCGGHFYTFVGSVPACKEACSTRANCKGIHYNTAYGKGQCWLQNFVCNPARAGHKTDKRWSQYTKGSCHEAGQVAPPQAAGDVCDYTHFTGWCGGHFQTFVGSVPACKAACSASAKCKGVHYNTKYNKGQCWLQNFVCDPARAGHKGNPTWNQYTKGNCYAGGQGPIPEPEPLVEPSQPFGLGQKFPIDMFEYQCPVGTKKDGEFCEVDDVDKFLPWLKANAEDYGISYTVEK